MARGRGRPKHVYSITGRAATKAKQVEALAAQAEHPPLKDPVDPVDTPHALSLPTFTPLVLTPTLPAAPSKIETYLSHAARPFSDEEIRFATTALKGVPSDKLENDPSTRAPFLPDVKRDPHVWRQLELVSTYSFHHWYDRQVCTCFIPIFHGNDLL